MRLDLEPKGGLAIAVVAIWVEKEADLFLLVKKWELAVLDIFGGLLIAALFALEERREMTFGPPFLVIEYFWVWKPS